MKDIKRRLEKLEQATKPVEHRECIVFLCVSFLEGELTALEGNGITVNRLPGETEQQLYDRAVIEVRRTAPGFPSASVGKVIYTLHEVREKAERDDEANKYLGVSPVAPQTKPDPVRGPEPRPKPKPMPKQIVEFKREYSSNISHWMMGD